uniref:Uncharacterized protein n=1 Tax=Knipowitschia caucasica TaxID=637954 RepID=A0AAV2JTJ3_KNICA
MRIPSSSRRVTAGVIRDRNTPEVIQEPPAPETPNLQNFHSPSETVSPPEKTVPPETGDVSSDAAHFMVSTMIRKLLDKYPVSLDIREQGKVILRLREVERRVSMPQGTDLKTKDLKTKAKEVAKSLREELGHISSALPQSNWFVEAAVRNLNIQLQDFDEDRGRRPGR